MLAQFHVHRIAGPKINVDLVFIIQGIDHFHQLIEGEAAKVHFTGL
jgi:hypothetical protein